MKLDEFKEKLDKFVDENCIVPDCKECHELCHSVMIEEGKAIEELFERIINNRIKLESSNLDLVAFDEETQELTIWFKNRKSEGQRYLYSKVPVTVFGELMGSESKGKFFGKRIRNIYEVKKID